MLVENISAFLLYTRGNERCAVFVWMLEKDSVKTFLQMGDINVMAYCHADDW